MTHRLLVGGELVLFGPTGIRDLFDEDEGFTAREVLEALAVVGSDDVTVRLNSGGGLAFEGIAIFNALRTHPGRVTLIVDGVAASAASVVAMAGDEIVMRAGAMMMIHDPSAVTIGTAERHRQSAANLDRLGERAAAIYAERTGRPVAEIRDLMRAETWMSAEDAVARGFADRSDEPTAQAPARFDYALYAHAPEHILRTAQHALPASTAAPAARSMEITMTESTPAVTTDTANPHAPAASVPTPEPEPRPTMQAPGRSPGQAPAREAAPVPEPDPAPAAPARDVTREIMSRCRAARLDLDQTMQVVEQAAGSVDRAKDLIITMIADRDPAPETRPHIQSGADQRERFTEGATRALLHRAGMEGGEVNELSALTLRELARESLARRGESMRQFRDPLMMVGAAMQPVMASGMHSTSDFVEVLANVANKAMLKGYQEAEETFEAWTARGVLVDFKPVKRVDLNLFPSLVEVPEGAEYRHGTIGDRGETIQLATYGRMFAITRQAIVNDDLNVFTRVPSRMGRAARRTIGNLVYAVLTANPAMSDGVALFHEDHANLAGTGAAPTVTSLDAARAAMARQRDPDGHATALNIRPRYFLVPVELEGVAATLMSSEFDPSKTQRTPNHVRGLATVISDGRLSAASTTAWYMATDPNQHDTIEVAWLNGNDQPTLEQRDGWSIDGVEFKVRIDAGVKALDFRGLYKNPGNGG